MGRGEHVRPRPAPPPKKNDGADSEWERRALKTRNGRGGAQNVHKPCGGGAHGLHTPPFPPPNPKSVPGAAAPWGGLGSFPGSVQRGEK